MKKCIAIVAGEPNSISSEIIFKTWILRKKFKHIPFFIIGNIKILNKQKKHFNFNFRIKKIDLNFNYKSLLGNHLPVLNVDFKQKKTFNKINKSSKTYIFNCFDLALHLIKKNKSIGLINCPISKEHLLNGRYKGITEYLSKKTKSNGNEVMLIYNSDFSVCPITTHVPIRKVSTFLTKKIICKKIITINNFYINYLKIKPKIGILGLNPHSNSNDIFSEEKKIIIPAINLLNKKKIKIVGPLSPDTSFIFQKENKLNVIVGMFHDQVLTPFKTLKNFKAINVTLGLPFFRASPDHGVGLDITGKKIANPTSLIESIKFFSKIN